MHCVDCKGVAGIVFGGMVSILLDRLALGRSRADRMEQLRVWAKDWYDRHPGVAKLPELKVKLVVTEGDQWCELHGVSVKAANTRAAAPLFRDMCAVHFASDSAEDISVTAMATSLCKFYEVLYRAPMFMCDADLADLRVALGVFGENLMRLREQARLLRKLRFNVTPKCHRMQHCHNYAGVLNPRWVQNYSEESLMGTTSKVWEKTMVGRYQKSAQSTVLIKRVLGLLLRFETSSQ